MAEDMGDRTEAPTAKRLADARENGQIPKSIDLSGAVDLIGAALVIYYFGHALTSGLGEMMKTVLSGGGPAGPIEGETFTRLFMWAVIRGAAATWPIVAIMFTIVLVGQIQQTGFHFSFKSLELKLERLNPFAGFGKIFNKKGVIKTSVSAVKMAFISAIIGSFIAAHTRDMAALPMLSLMGAVSAVMALVAKLIVWLLSIMLTVGVADYFYQLWQHKADLKMTKHQVKEERKSSEGDIEMRGKRLRMGREIITQRLKSAVPKADVIITNPTHYAVALKYDPASMAAPVVLAKGADYVALRIREMASAAGIPIIEKPSLARALYNTVPVGREVPNQFYEAVAEILAYVYRISGRAEAAQQHAAEAADAAKSAESAEAAA